MLKIIVIESAFNIDFLDTHFNYTHDHEELNFLTNELLQIG